MCFSVCDVVNQMLFSGKLRRDKKNMLDILQVDELNSYGQLIVPQ